MIESVAHTCVGISNVLYSMLSNSFFPSRVDKKRDKIERKILDSQERAFWDVHRPVVGEVTDVVFNMIITQKNLNIFSLLSNTLYN